MPPAISRKTRGAVGAFVVFALLLTALLLLWPRSPQAVSRIMDARVTGLLEGTNGVVGVTVVLSNRTLHPLNIVDDSSGGPAFFFSERGGPTADGRYGILVSDMVNQLKVNLAAGTTLTNTVWITNPPTRFRIGVQVRDLRKESREFPWFRYIGRDLASRLDVLLSKTRNLEDYVEVYAPTSGWIESGDYEK